MSGGESHCLDEVHSACARHVDSESSWRVYKHGMYRPGLHENSWQDSLKSYTGIQLIQPHLICAFTKTKSLMAMLC